MWLWLWRDPALGTRLEFCSTHPRRGVHALAGLPPHVRSIKTVHTLLAMSLPPYSPRPPIAPPIPIHHMSPVAPTHDQARLASFPFLLLAC